MFKSYAKTSRHALLAVFILMLTIVACSSTKVENGDDEPAPEPVEQESALEYEPEELEVFEEGGSMGYRTADKEVVIEPRYVMAQPFDEYGIAAVRDDQGWAYIDAAGETLVRVFEFDNGPDYFSEGMARYVDGDKMGYVDRKAQVVIEAQFDFATPFEDGRAEVCTGCEEQAMGEHSMMVGGQWWAIDADGEKLEELPPPEER